LKENRVAEEGTYSKLVQMDSHFKRMVEQQALGGAKVGSVDIEKEK
ncbi:unnamed protein product, partial [marine sediment metagenome]